MGYLRYPFAEKYHHQQQHNTSHQRREAGAATGFHVDDGLANHGATRHAAHQAGGDIGHALAFAFAVLVAGCIGQVVNNRSRHHGLQQAHYRQCCRVGEDDLQRLDIQVYFRPQKERQRIRQLAHVPHSADIKTDGHGHRGQRHNAHQWRRNDLADPGHIGEQVDDAKARCGHGIDMPGNVGQFRYWAIKIRMASAFTKPVTTERDTKRMRLPSFR